MRDKFGEHCKIISGFAFKSEDLLDKADIPVIKIGNISNSGDVIIDEGTQYVTSDFLSINEKYHIKKGDILISLTGSHINQPNSMVGRACRNYSDTVYLLNQRAGRVIENNNTDKDYLYYLLMIRAIKESIVTRAFGAANQVNISPTAIENIKWDFPDIETQKTIGKILSSYDQSIINNNKRIKILEQMLVNLYKEWFVRLRFPGYEKTEIKNEIPSGWYRSTIADVSIVNQRGISPEYDDDGEFTVISQKCVRSNVMDIAEARHQSKHYKSELNLQDGDTVICSTGTGTLGRVGRVIGNYPNTTYDSHVTLVRAKDGISKQYLYGAIKELQPWFMNMGIGSTNQQELYITTIRKATIMVPEEKVMNRFECIAKRIHDEIGILIIQNNYLSKQRDLLLPRLFSGKLSVLNMK